MSNTEEKQFRGKKHEVNADGARVITGHYDEIKDWRMDPKGYFLIRINPETKMLEVGHCIKGNEVLTIVQGDKPQDVYFSVVTEGITEDPIHLAYLGKELEKAFIARKLGIEYVQDSELEF